MRASALVGLLLALGCATDQRDDSQQASSSVPAPSNQGAESKRAECYGPEFTSTLLRNRLREVGVRSHVTAEEQSDGGFGEGPNMLKIRLSSSHAAMRLIEMYSTGRIPRFAEAAQQTCGITWLRVEGPAGVGQSFAVRP